MCLSPLPKVDALAESTFDVFRESPLFSALEPAELNKLVSHAHTKRFSPQESIFLAGDEGHSIMSVISGTVRISFPAEPGKEVILADVGAGEVFGEIALLDGGGRSADATAITNVELALLDRRDVLRFLEDHPKACLALLSGVCRMLRVSDERMADIAFADVETRLAKVIIGNLIPARGLNRVPLSQSELARMVVASREAVNRQLAAWQRDNIVVLKEGWIRVLNRDRITLLAGRRRPIS